MSLGLNSGCVAAAGNLTTTHNSTNFIMGYYINPNVTPLSGINFTALKSAGITDIYVLVTNNNYLPVLSEAKKKADAVGIRTNAWVYPGFNYASKVAGMKIGVQLDVYKFWP
jgi:dTDP-glucose pyrophosphorylase